MITQKAFDEAYERITRMRDSATQEKINNIGGGRESNEEMMYRIYCSTEMAYNEALRVLRKMYSK